MSCKHLAIILVVCVACGIISIGVVYRAQLQSDNNTAGLIPSEFQKYCQITEGGLYENLDYGFRFGVGNSFVVCDYESPATLNSPEIFLLAKDALNQTTTLVIAQGIAGKILINPSQDLLQLPGATSVTTTTALIAGLPTVVTTLRQLECKTAVCPQWQMADLEHDGKTFVIVQYIPMVDLLQTFTFAR